MPYYAYLAFNDGEVRPGQYWGRKPIAYVDFCKNKKDAGARLEQLIERHPDLLPAEGWRRIQHRKLDTEDNRVVERMKKDIRLRMATKSLSQTGERRLWAKTPGAPAGCYRLDYYEANQVLRDALDRSGLYRPGGR